MQNLVELRGVTVSYDGYRALEDVDLDIRSDDFIGVIGPNGGGKTTLVNAVLGNVPCTGSVVLSDELFRDGQRLIGYMPQVSTFDRAFPITVSDVVLSGLQSSHGFTRRYSKDDVRRASELLSMAGIEDVADKPIGEISGGQMQRAMLCRAIVSEPRLLILDEPTTYVDNRFEKELYALLQELSGRMAIMMVSHDLGTITSVVRSIVCVNRRVHRHDSNVITEEQLLNYDCPLQIISHGDVPHTVLHRH